MVSAKYLIGVGAAILLPVSFHLALAQPGARQHERSSTKSDQSRKICERTVANGRYLSSSDITNLVTEILQKSPAKDEFESTNDYEKRVSQIHSSIVASLDKRIGLPYVAIAKRNGAYPRATYNADQRSLIFDFPTGYILTRHPGIDFNRVIIPVSEAEVVVDSYLASNGLGARTQVTVQKATVVGISLSRCRTIST